MSITKTTGLRSATVTNSGLLSGSLKMILFAGLTAVGAQIEIPNVPVPFTLQTLFVLLSGALLGGRLGAGSMVLYLVAGAAGLPVFSSFGFGLAKILGPTGGYLLAFPLAAFAVGYLAGSRPQFPRLLLSMIAGLLIIFTSGTVQLYLVYTRDWAEAFGSGFLIFSWWDVVKLLGAASIARAFPGRKNPLS